MKATTPPNRALVTLVTLLVTVGSARSAEPIVTSDLLRLRTASAIDVARDGTTAVFAVRSIHTADTEADDAAMPEHRSQSHIFAADLSTTPARVRQLTRGDRVDRGPRLSPDGRHVAFVRNGGHDDDDPAGARVWVMPLDGGEAWPTAPLPHGASGPTWSPDGRWLLVSSPLPLDEIDATPPWVADPAYATPADATPRPDGTRQEIRRWLADNARREDPVVINRLDFQDERRLSGPMRLRQLYRIDPHDTAATPVQLTSVAKDHRDAVFMPDGRSLLYHAKRQTGAHPDEVLATSLWQVDADGGNAREVLAIDGFALRGPEVSADGSVVAFLARALDEPAHRPYRLGVAPWTADTLGEPMWLTGEATLDASVRSFQWLPARSALVFNVARQGGFPLMTMGLGLLEPADLVSEIDGAQAGIHAYGVGGGTVVYAVTTVEQPCVIRVRDARSDRVVLDLNEWVQEKEIARPRSGWITRPDGRRVQYWVMEPTRRRPDERVPVALEIHGGPSAMWGPGELTMWHEFQLLCSWGYGVVYANPRGSGGYGYDFQRANYQDWGDGPAGDVLAVLDQVSLEDWVDSDQLVVTGGSYGGYLTAWIVAHDQRFRAAVAQRGVYDLTTFYGEGNAWQLVEWSMGGPPWDVRVRPVLQRESPLTSINRIRTPLLILHASNDLRTGVSQSEMLYRGLRRLGRPVEYVRYPDAGHDLSRSGAPHQRMDRLNRIVEWFERHVDNARPAPTLDRMRSWAPEPSEAATEEATPLGPATPPGSG
ncbi:MAG: S9 family peptidase [Phycisphaerales bacterium]|nr:S9 family peptidase [Phycisphaerales bacterium]